MASVAGDPIAGITKKGSTKVATIEPVVFTASSAPVADPSVPVSSPSRAAVAGKVIPIATVAGSTMKTACAANRPSASTNSELPPWSGKLGAERIAAPTHANTAVRIWAAAINVTAERTRGRRTPSMPAPSAMPVRNSTRMVVKT